MSSKILREIKDINKSVKLITFTKEKHEYGYKFNHYNFQVMLDNDKYEFKFDAEHNCCERFGYNTNLGDGQNNDIVNNNELLGENISMIQILYKSDGEEQNKILIQFIKAEQILFTIQFYNNHNGYYPHSFRVNLYENNDAQPMNILNTSI